LDSLTPRERQTWFELLRLATPEETWVEEYNLTLPKGGWILSYRQLERCLDLTRSTIRRALHRLAEKGLIEWIRPVRSKSGTHTPAVIRICHYPFLPPPPREGAPLGPLALLFHMEMYQWRSRLEQIRLLRQQMETELSIHEREQLLRLEQAYLSALETLAAPSTTDGTVKPVTKR
jgi:hypothetical protein